MGHDTIGRPMDVLLVEDSLPAARMAMGALKRGSIKHRLTWLRDGAEAMQFLRHEGRFSQAPHPDLLLLDLRLPGMDGRDVLDEMQYDDALRDLPVVVMTSSTDERDEIERENLNVHGFMPKPVELTKFLEVVSQLKQYWKADMILPTPVS